MVGFTTPLSWVLKHFEQCAQLLCYVMDFKVEKHIKT